MADGLPEPPQVQPPEGQPRVRLDWSLWCARHLEPYRARWPRGAPLAMARLFEAACAMPAVIAWCGGGGDQLADAGKLTEALQRFRPLCCLVGKDAMDRIYAETLPRLPGSGDG